MTKGIKEELYFPCYIHKITYSLFFDDSDAVDTAYRQLVNSIYDMELGFGKSKKRYVKIYRQLSAIMEALQNKERSYIMRIESEVY